MLRSAHTFAICLLVLTMPMHARSAEPDAAAVANRLLRVLNSPENEKAYFGTPVSMESREATVPEVLRLVGHRSGLNVLWDHEVEDQKVSLSIKDVPWDQLLDIVIAQRGLKVLVTGNVVQIMTGESYRKRLANRREVMRMEGDGQRNELIVFPLDYARPADVKRIIESVTVPESARTTDQKKN